MDFLKMIYGQSRLIFSITYFEFKAQRSSDQRTENIWSFWLLFYTSTRSEIVMLYLLIFRTMDIVRPPLKIFVYWSGTYPCWFKGYLLLFRKDEVHSRCVHFKPAFFLFGLFSFSFLFLSLLVIQSEIFINHGGFNYRCRLPYFPFYQHT